MHASDPAASQSRDTLAGWRALLNPLQDRFARVLGVDPARRGETVVAMLASNVRRAPGYWIQLFLSAGIATLGLALGSTAVVIGAMLVSPLMGPIVELGMGFAVGSSLLVLRAALCVTLSVGGVIATAAAITLALPFHEVNAEIASRTSPTLLDLLVAVFCALIAVYTTIRQTTDTTAAAAGTAIGIALVPPLCVVGFGLGTADGATAGGALLLFVANFSAIAVIAVVVFLSLGYARVNATSLEHEFVESSPGGTTTLARRAHLGLRLAFGSQYGLAMRLLVPALFFLVVLIPLRRALDNVTWQVRVRNAVHRIVVAESPNAVQSSVVVDHDAVSLRLLIVGQQTQAAELERVLTTRIAAAAGVAPTVSVTAVADARSLAAQRAATPRGAAAPDRLKLAAALQRVSEALSTNWPASGGPLLGWSFEISNALVPMLTARHLGQPLGAPAVEMLAQRLSDSVGTRVTVADVALPVHPLVADKDLVEPAWLAAAVVLLDHVGRAPAAVGCVEGPIDAKGRSSVASEAKAVAEALRATAASREGRLTLIKGRQWSVRVAARSCDPLEQNAQTVGRR